MTSNFARKASKAKDDPANSDEWLLIDKIFTAAGADYEEDLEIDRLLSIIHIAAEDSPIFEVLTSTLNTIAEESAMGLLLFISRENLHKILFQRKLRSTFLEKL